MSSGKTKNGAAEIRLNGAALSADPSGALNTRKYSAPGVTATDPKSTRAVALEGTLKSVPDASIAPPALGSPSHSSMVTSATPPKPSARSTRAPHSVVAVVRNDWARSAWPNVAMHVLTRVCDWSSGPHIGAGSP